MTHRTARERLLFEAKDLARDVLTLDGIRGHSARLEPSPHGPARLIRVFHDGTEVCWTFEMEAGEARPPFYPDDVPLLDRLSASVTWDEEEGLQVRWMMPSNRERIAEIMTRLAGVDLTDAPRGLGELAQELPTKTKEERAELWRDFEQRQGGPLRNWTRKMLGDVASRRLPEEVTAAVEDVVAFHEGAGWVVVDRGATEGPSRTVLMRHGSTERVLQAISVVGITMIALSDGG